MHPVNVGWQRIGANPKRQIAKKIGIARVGKSCPRLDRAIRARIGISRIALQHHPPLCHRKVRARRRRAGKHMRLPRLQRHDEPLTHPPSCRIRRHPVCGRRGISLQAHRIQRHRHIRRCHSRFRCSQRPTNRHIPRNRRSGRVDKHMPRRIAQLARIPRHVQRARRRNRKPRRKPGRIRRHNMPGPRRPHRADPGINLRLHRHRSGRQRPRDTQRRINRRPPAFQPITIIRRNRSPRLPHRHAVRAIRRHKLHRRNRIPPLRQNMRHQHIHPKWPGLRHPVRRHPPHRNQRHRMRRGIARNHAATRQPRPPSGCEAHGHRLAGVYKAR